jgi:Na+/melibiose symporter-like transporter
LYNGILLGVFGLFSVVVILFTKFLARKFPERNILASGYIMSLVASIALLPWGTDYPSVQQPSKLFLQIYTFLISKKSHL